jgi:hypothetical protein
MDLNIKIINEEEFIEMIGGNNDNWWLSWYKKEKEECFKKI